MADAKEVAGVGGNNILQSENVIFDKMITRRNIYSSIWHASRRKVPVALQVV